MNNNVQEKDEAVQSVINDEAFLKSIIKMNIKDAQKAFADRVVILSDKEMITIRNLVNAQANSKKPLSEQTLGNVGGGLATRKIKNLAIALSALAVGSTAIVLGYKGYKALDKMEQTLDSAKDAADEVTNLMPKVNQILEKADDAATGVNIAIEHIANPADKTVGYGILFGGGFEEELKQRKKAKTPTEPPKQ